VPAVRLHNPLLAVEVGALFMRRFELAAAGESGPFLLVVEGSIPNEAIKREGVWAGFGVDPESGQPIPTVDWIDRLAPRAWVVVAAGTCAAFGGVHAMEGNPTGAMGLSDHLGPSFLSAGGLPVVNVPGCPVHPDDFMETLLYLLYQAAGRAPRIPLDAMQRPAWIFEATVHEGCDRGGYYEQADFATEYGTPECIVKAGCWGPVVKCNVPKRGWMGGVGGCPNVGGICIGCTMPGFPDKNMPFMDEPPGAHMSTAAVEVYGRTVHALRRFTLDSMDAQPEFRRRGALSSGYLPPWEAPGEGGKAR
jgi:hydrogenase small subunit